MVVKKPGSGKGGKVLGRPSVPRGLLLETRKEKNPGGKLRSARKEAS